MKASQLIIGVGAAAALGLLVWYLYMQQSPNYKRAQTRGLPTNVSKSKAAPSAKPKAAQPDPAKAAKTPSDKPAADAKKTPADKPATEGAK